MSRAFTKAGVIGHPVGHSLSPLIHGYWIGRHGLSGTYEALDIAPGTLEQAVQNLVAAGYAGFNVTLPYKQDIMKFCAALDGTARQIGAVNTVRIEDGVLYGRNTDAFGFIENIKKTLPDFDFAAGPAFILGAGGAARAVIYGLLEAGVKEIRIVNRTRGKAEALARDFPLNVADWEERERAAEGAALLVNTTALGMKGKPALAFDLKFLPPGAAVCDIVYAPLYTDLLQAARAAGHPVVTGIGMLLHQARPAFESWFGVLPEVTDELEQKLIRAAQ